MACRTKSKCIGVRALVADSKARKCTSVCSESCMVVCILFSRTFSI